MARSAPSNATGYARFVDTAPRPAEIFHSLPRSEHEKEGRDPDADFDVRTTLMHDVPPEVVAEAFARGEPRQSETPFSEPWPLEA
jgi:hypothetical protein